MKKNHLSRRRFLQVSAMAGGAWALAACAPAGAPAGGEEAAGSSDAAPAAEGATVSYWAGWGQLEAAINAMLETDEWQSHMEGLTLEYRGSVNSEAILTAVAGGTPPDCHSNHDYPNLYTRGAVLPVQDMVESSDIVNKDMMLQWTWDYAFFGGDMIGVPGIESYVQWGLNYNIDAAEKAELDVENLPVTWAEALEWHKAMTIKDDAGNLIQLGLDPNDAMGGDVDFQTSSYGIQWYDEDTREFHLDDERMVDIFATTSEFIKIAGPDQFAGMRQVQGNGAWGAAFEAGVQTMIIEGYWHPGETMIAKPEIGQYNRATWSPVSEDRRDVKMQAVNAHFVQIFKEAKNPTGAFRLGEWFNTVTACDIIFKEVGWIHPVKEFIPMIDPNAFPGLDFYVQSEQEATEWHLLRRCPIHWFVKDQWDALRDQVAREEVTPEEAAAQLNQRALDEWDAQGLSM
ncbi:MAG: extracellular solute-binding protein [Caldilineaceae bacterium]|nr:extracellular solute-binding protein [Caldilineaceae bacterium]